MLTLKPELQQAVHVSMKITDPRHIPNAGTVGFSGGYGHGGITRNFSDKNSVSLIGHGNQIVSTGEKTGAGAVLRDGAAGGLSFSDEMLKAIDKVSAMENRASQLSVQAITDPASVDAHDLTIAEAEAAMSLNIARTILSRLTQAWKDVINTR
ncbi:MAG: flagellar hook-basal body complex protein FliE [Spirochaetaceae bacterium]|jgi:flagellar hook-basal body complex protein FliE|nr:flagellar hook-basal body complex protein FliE [Spirochaetaceae bacterium]